MKDNKRKYLKYKHKYINLKNSIGGNECKPNNIENGPIMNMFKNLINFFKGWDKGDAYEGMELFNKKPRSTFEGLIEYKTTIDIKQIPTLKNISNLNLDKYEPNVVGIRKFLMDFNFIESKKFSFTNPTFYRIEGSSNEHLGIHNKILKQLQENEKAPLEHIAEIGFNAGISAINFLENSKDTIIVSFDLMLHDYCWYAKMFIDRKYPGRHILISGDSALQVKAFGTISDIKFDLIFIDGDHNYESAYMDIINSKKLAHADTILVLDNVAPHAGCGIGPYLAMNNAIKENEIRFIKHYEISGYKDGFAILKYNFNKEAGNKIDYIKIERLVPMYYLTDILERIKGKTPEVEENIKLILNYFKKYDLPIDKILQDKIDEFVK